MILFTAVPREQMLRNHARHIPHTSGAQGRSPMRNGRAVLDLGNLTYFTFRGAAYGVPPVGWQLGQRLALVWNELEEFNDQPLTRPKAALYFALMGKIPAVLWPRCRPVGRWRRCLKRLGLLRNPFRAATEVELIELVSFFLGRRMMSSVGPLPTAPLPSSTS